MNAPRPDLQALSPRQLLDVIRDAGDELRRRKILTTDNAPVGDYAEYLVWIARGGTIETNSNRSYDLTLPDGWRIQVKGRRMKGFVSEFGAFPDFDFDSAVFVVVDPETHEVAAARELTAAEVAANALPKGKGVRMTGGRVAKLGRDVTAELRAASDKVDAMHWA